MEVREDRRLAAIERMAEFLLTEGLAAATLRPLAAAAGTSDRMLLYYFKDRDEILSATLHYFAERMLAQLDEAVPPGKLYSFRTLLDEVCEALASQEIRRSMHLWLDLAAGASRGFQPHLKIGGEMAERFTAWIAHRLAPRQEGQPTTSAALFLTLIEGMHLLEALGRADVGIDAARELVALLPEKGGRKKPENGAAVRKTLASSAKMK